MFSAYEFQNELRLALMLKKADNGGTATLKAFRAGMATQLVLDKAPLGRVMDWGQWT